MTSTEFKRDRQGIIIVWARLEGPLGSRKVRLALDTGAAMTLILPDVLDDLGYGARDGDRITSISTANAAPEQGYRLRVKHFDALGFGFPDFGSTRTSFRITASRDCSAWTFWGGSTSK